MQLRSWFSAVSLACGITCLAAAAHAADSQPNAKQIEEIAKSQQALQAPLQLGVASQSQYVCAGWVPAGWVMVGDMWSPTSCGNPTRITYNVWLIESLADKAVGSTMYICNGPVPSGWSVVGSTWSPNTCGHPTRIMNNQLIIRRMS
ncbi:hypothetical protein [Chromobacterium sp. IIBBL 290-4]|uniref:hypothetical protein n=1 Tax=Chromobacterium sp. IIBBL 290-4 TaxID=2953890 RepID=UPI0020B7673A|nr:hypothetical protein [Chromobacterium sp. IIBBL 290-4]UTH74821.1 hypothetical protein NKT35_01555 [Chromobacterium sp. IIBBL 290-4]